MDHPTIAAEARTELGTTAAKRCRAAGRVPAVIMRSGEESLHVTVDETAAEAALTRDSHCLAVDYDGAHHVVMVKEVSRDCLTDRMQHLDLLAVTDDSLVKVEVDLRPLTDDCPGIKAGGLLEQMLRQVRVRCAVKDIPDHVDVDLGEAVIGHTVYADDVAVPAGIRLLTPGRTALMSVIKTRGLKKAESEALAGEEGADGEAAPAAEAGANGE